MVSDNMKFNIVDTDVLREYEITEEIINLEEKIDILKEILKIKSFEEFWDNFKKSKDVNNLELVELDKFDRQLIIPEFIIFDENKICSYDYNKIRIFAEKFDYTIVIRPADMSDRIINS